MKLRIKGNSVRIRLTRTEVTTIASDGYIEEQTVFGNSSCTYALKRVDTVNELSASVEPFKITMLVPAAFTNDWPQNDVVGINTKMPIPGNKELYLLLEKDFVCLDETFEDQSDNYDNPNKTC